MSGTKTTLNGWPEIRAALAGIVGAQNCLSDPEEIAPYCEDWRQLHKGSTPAVVRPACTAEVASVVRLCAERRVAIVPQGGNTGLVNGGTPGAEGNEIVLSLSRMNRVRDLDAPNLALTVDAGITLKAAQQTVLDSGCMLPISMGSEGSAQIGGALSTNAGGNYTVLAAALRAGDTGEDGSETSVSLWLPARQRRTSRTRRPPRAGTTVTSSSHRRRSSCRSPAAAAGPAPEQER